MGRLVVPVVVVIVLGMMLIALVLPSTRDRTLAGWWFRIRRDIALFFRSLLALVSLAAIVWFIVLPLLGWR